VPSLQRFNQGESPVASSKLNLIVDALSGAGNTPVNHGGVNDPLNYALTVRNQDAAGKALVILGPNGSTVLLQVTASGVLATPDGTAAAAPLATTTGTQTLTNKTLTSPILNNPTISGVVKGDPAWSDPVFLVHI
jgi:hypothetical protein